MLNQLRPQGRIVTVAGFLVIQAALVSWIAGGEKLPPSPALEQFPSTLGDWTKANEEQVDSGTITELHADRLISWNYVQAANTTSPANWFLVWFQTQRHGAQPHSPKVCLPGTGWIPEVSQQVRLTTTGEIVTANLYIVRRGSLRAVVLYWFQTPRRAISSEWAAKFWTVADAVRDHRTDMALARVVVYEGERGETAAIAAAVDFAEKAYPALRKSILEALPVKAKSDLPRSW